MALIAKTYLSVVAKRHPSDVVHETVNGKTVTRPTRPGDANFKPRTRFIKPGQLVPEGPEGLPQKDIDDHVKKGFIIDSGDERAVADLVAAMKYKPDFKIEVEIDPPVADPAPPK